MPRNGSGTFAFNASTWSPAVDGVTATSGDWNTNVRDDIATGLTNSVSKDGQTPLTGNLNFNNNRATNLSAAVSISDAARAGDVQSGAWQYLTAVAGTDTITASLTGFTAYAAGNTFRFIAAGTNTGAVTLNINAVGAKSITKNGTGALVAGDILSGGTYEVVYDGTRFQLVGQSINSTNAASMRATLAISLRSAISGLVPSTAGSSATITVSAGEAADGTNVDLLSLAASISKTTSAWAVGSAQGGLDTGAIANNTAYYLWLIKRVDTGVVDVLISLSSSAPTMPANYTLKRLIGYGLTNGSAQWVGFVATETAGGGLDWVWLAPVLDLNTAVLTTSRLLTTLTVPVLAVTANIRFNMTNAGSVSIAIQCPDETDAAPSGTASPGTDLTNAAGAVIVGFKTVRTSSSGQVASRSTAASTTLRIITQGFQWSRR